MAEGTFGEMRYDEHVYVMFTRMSRDVCLGALEKKEHPTGSFINIVSNRRQSCGGGGCGGGVQDGVN